MVCRFVIVKFNKVANISVPSLDRVSLWKFALWDLLLLGKHYTEMNLISNEKQSFMLGYISYDHGHDEALQMI